MRVAEFAAGLPLIGAAAVFASGLVAGQGPATHPSARFAAIDDIDPSNVGRLQVAWTAHTGEFAGGKGPSPPGPVEGFQTRPLLAGSRLIVTTTTSKVIALDADAGAEARRYDPVPGRGGVCDRHHRGVTRRHDTD